MIALTLKPTVCHHVKATTRTQGLPVYDPTRLTQRDTGIKDIYARSADERLINTLAKIIEHEAPIMTELALRRLAEGFGVTRATQRFRERFEEILSNTIGQNLALRQADVLWHPSQNQAHTARYVPALTGTTPSEISKTSP